MKTVARVLHHLRDARGCDVDWCGYSRVHGAQLFGGTGIAAPDECERWTIEVRDRSTFSQELRIHAHTEVHAGLSSRRSLECRDHQFLESTWHDGAAHDDGVMLGLRTQRFANLAAGALEIAQVDAPVRTTRCTDAHK